MTTRLFVYGTLRRAARHSMHEVLAGATRFLGDARVPGRLYHLGSYPGMVAGDGGGTVIGEVYEVDPAAWPALIQRLDEYEACSERHPQPHEFRRVEVQAELASGEIVAAWAYVYNRDCEGLRAIASGDYLASHDAT
jgi:gamma-glutamylcyclotransferase (GGCT)/AIG2-like uncharacterized protein YtfP